MSNLPRPYRDDRDLEAMRTLSGLGKKVNTGSYYVHPGDLDWQLHYPPQEEARKRTIFVWKKSAQASSLLGWTLRTHQHRGTQTLSNGWF